MKLIDTIGRFKVVKCRCGVVSSTSSNVVFKCFSCDRSSKIVKKSVGVMTHFGVKVLFSSNSEREVGEFVRKYKELVYKGDVRNDFHSYKSRGDE